MPFKLESHNETEIQSFIFGSGDIVIDIIYTKDGLSAGILLSETSPGKIGRNITEEQLIPRATLRFNNPKSVQAIIELLEYIKKYLEILEQTDERTDH